MSNKHIFGGNVQNPLISASAVIQANLEGRVFCALTQDINVSNNESVVVKLTNASNSNINAISHDMMTTGLVDMSVDFIRNAVYSGGTTTSLMVCPLNTDFPEDSGKITASKIQGALTLTSGTTLCSRSVPKAGEGIYYATGALILTPGNSIAFQCTAKANGIVNIDISWYEIAR